MKIDFLEDITTRKRFKRKTKKTQKLDFFSDLEFFRRRKNKEVVSVVFAFLVLISSLYLLARSFELQIVKGKENALLSDLNRTKTFFIPAERGVIYDRDGEILVRNMPSFSLIMDSRSCFGSESSYQKCTDTINSISQVFRVEKDRAFKDLSEKKPNIILAKNLTKDEVLKLEPSLVSYSGIEVVTYPTRDYLYKDSFAHLVGYVGSGDTLYPSIEGKVGIEEYYDEFLSGVSGRKIIQTDSTGNKISDITVQDATPGEDVYLNVDKGLQLLAYDLIKDKVDSGEAVAGAVVAQDPKSGGVLALVSYPSFDPQALVSGISSEEFAKLQSDPGFPFFDRAVSASYPPGSVFKMIPASGALMEGVVSENTTIIDKGFIQIGSYIFRNWKLDGHGQVNLKRALQVSNDTYFYTVGGGYGDISGLGIDKLSEWAYKFGLGQVTGIDIHGEVPGYFPNGTEREWYLGDTYITSIGQGDTLVTPLQINNMVSYFANGGFLMKPRIVREAGGVEFDHGVLNQGLVSDHVYRTVREGIKMVVEPGGTGYPFFDFEIDTAGKTGTAEYINSKGEESTHAWFTAFGSYENATISLTVFLEGGASGADDAAPIARELMEYFLKHPLQ